MQAISARFSEQIARTFGDEGRAWLADLPCLIDHYTTRWRLTIEGSFPNLSYNYVAPARRADGAELVLKLGLPRPELITEAAALQLCAGRGCARLLDADPDGGALLLERLRPGQSLLTLADDEHATAIAIELMVALQRPPPAEHPFPSVANWAAGLAKLRPHFGGPGPFPPQLLAEAEQLFADLLPSQAAAVVLHGDLHHDNIVAAGTSWLAIDPKGVVGEPAYEAGALLRNPYPALLSWPDLPQITARRIDQLAEGLSVPRERIRGWGLAQALLSAWWDCEEQGGGSEWIAIASAIAAA